MAKAKEKAHMKKHRGRRRDVTGRRHPTVSLCMIARNEAPVIERALRSVQGFVDEMVVVDTGSTDGTDAVARACGARVVPFAWTDSFAEARNVYLKEARGDWILVLDADEALDRAARAVLSREMAEPMHQGKVRALCLRELSYRTAEAASDSDLQGTVSATENFLPRFFPRHEELIYRGVIHEQLVHHKHGSDGVDFQAVRDAVIHHYGYTPEEFRRKDRMQRNVPLLEREVLDSPDSAFAHYNLAQARRVMRRYEDALRHLERSIDLAPPARLGGRTARYMSQREISLAHTLWQLGRWPEAVATLRQAVLDFPGMPDAPFLLGNLLRARGDAQGAEEAYRQAMDATSSSNYFGISDVGTGTWKPRVELGMLEGSRGRWEEALRWLREAQEVAPRTPIIALALGACLHLLLRWDEALRAWSEVDLELLASPRILAHVAQARLRTGDREGAVAIARTAAARHLADEDAVLCPARILAEAGEGEAALGAYQEALRAQPHVNGWLEMGEHAEKLGQAARATEAYHAAARLALEQPGHLNDLGVAALRRGDLAAARGHLEKALAVDPGYDPAAWNLSCVLMREGDGVGALDMLGRRLVLDQRGVTEIVRTWRSFACGARPDSPVRHDPLQGIVLAAAAAIRAGRSREAVEWLRALEAEGDAPPEAAELLREAERAHHVLEMG